MLNKVYEKFSLKELKESYKRLLEEHKNKNFQSEELDLLNEEISTRKTEIIVKEQIKARLGLIREHKNKENLLNVILSFITDLEKETGKSYYLTIREFKIRK